MAKLSKVDRQTARRAADQDHASAFATRPSADELYAMGKALRARCPRASHAKWKAPDNRPDPVRLVQQADKGRLRQLIPLRHGRMLQSPFAFYRGTALNMATDLAHTPSSGMRVQCCGDAHLMNFGALATPERRVTFEINDLDETLPAPWEWDVKRLASSFALACRANGLSDKVAQDAVLTCVRAYRKRMARYGRMRVLEVWYDSLQIEELIERIQYSRIHRRAVTRLAKAPALGGTEHGFPRLAQQRGEAARIEDNLPTIYHYRGNDRAQWHGRVRNAFTAYRRTVLPSVRVLLDRFEFKDIAIKIVGVGSVGTLCSVILMMAGGQDPLFLQVKEARASVLEAYAGKSTFPNQGQRVVNGYHLMQEASDVFLGWSEGKDGRHFYIRQLRDGKIKLAVETFGSSEMLLLAQWCGWALAHSHARSGQPAVIAGYLGKSDVFDKALAAFARAYADQTERDHKAFSKAVRQKRLEVLIERS